MTSIPCIGMSLTYLLKSEISIPSRDYLTHRFRRNHFAFGFNLVGNAKLLVKDVLDIDAAGTVGIGNRVCVRERVLKSFNSADIWLRRARPDSGSNERTSKIGLARSYNLAFLNKLFQRFPHYNDNIDCSPRAMRLGTACGVSPIEGPQAFYDFMAGDLLKL